MFAKRITVNIVKIEIGYGGLLYSQAISQFLYQEFEGNIK